MVNIQPAIVWYEELPRPLFAYEFPSFAVLVGALTGFGLPQTVVSGIADISAGMFILPVSAFSMLARYPLSSYLNPFASITLLNTVSTVSPFWISTWTGLTRYPWPMVIRSTVIVTVPFFATFSAAITALSVVLAGIATPATTNIHESKMAKNFLVILFICSSFFALPAKSGQLCWRILTLVQPTKSAFRFYPWHNAFFVPITVEKDCAGFSPDFP